MNKHLKALLIVGGLAALIFSGVLVYQARTQLGAQDGAGMPKAVIQLHEELPEFESKTLSGKEIRLSQFKGKIVIVNFWASWCGPCVEEIPSLIKLLRAFPNDLELVAISGDSTLEDIDSFIKSFPEMKTLPNIHLVWDTEKKLSQQYQIYRLPESFLLNKELKLVKKVSGTIDWHNEDAIAYMRQLVGAASKTQGK